MTKLKVFSYSTLCELKFQRGTAAEVAEIMKQGGADLAISGAPPGSWERIDAWPLFTEGYGLLVNARHRLGDRTQASIDDLRQERLLTRTYCEQSGQLASQLRSLGLACGHGHDVSSERDLISLLENDMGVAIAPRSTSVPDTVRSVTIDALDLQRTVNLYAVSGRPRSAATTTLIKQLRAADWARNLA